MSDTGYVSEMTRNGVCGNKSGNRSGERIMRRGSRSRHGRGCGRHAGRVLEGELWGIALEEGFELLQQLRRYRCIHISSKSS